MTELEKRGLSGLVRDPLERVDRAGSFGVVLLQNQTTMSALGSLEVASFEYVDVLRIEF